MRLDDTYLRVGKIENTPTSFGTAPVHPVYTVTFRAGQNCMAFFLVYKRTELARSTRTTYDTRLASI